ncbi:uncharacterized protein EI90DRAFT_3050944 [Cantharellus anzutake]|uniref:uncharacterized protein n=1 Tax=Cantharellus anzutake TaxID=1750568 RepID=UPI001905C6F7|nr:uncharacterized protein EI90DRAFT_3050944 [Cantharellus anzutake]KAF8334089.1 hypothetical protein EI90DRAFT_3050944 [Cantharellus anzutake]
MLREWWRVSLSQKALYGFIFIEVVNVSELMGFLGGLPGKAWIVVILDVAWTFIPLFELISFCSSSFVALVDEKPSFPIGSSKRSSNVSSLVPILLNFPSLYSPLVPSPSDDRLLEISNISIKDCIPLGVGNVRCISEVGSKPSTGFG